MKKQRCEEWEEKKKEDQRRERGRRKKMQVREKVGKSRQAGSLKRRVRSHVARWEMKNCTLLWREEHFEVKSVKKLTVSDHFWKSRCWKSARRCHAARSTFPSQNAQAHQRRSTFGSCDVEKAHAVVARSTFPSQKVQSTRCSDHFWTFRFGFAWQAQGILHLAKKWAKRGVF